MLGCVMKVIGIEGSRLEAFCKFLEEDALSMHISSATAIAGNGDRQKLDPFSWIKLIKGPTYDQKMKTYTATVEIFFDLDLIDVRRTSDPGGAILANKVRVRIPFPLLREFYSIVGGNPEQATETLEFEKSK